MTWQDRLKNIDSHSSVAKEFRVYTTHGAILSVMTVLLMVYLVYTEAAFHLQVVTHERVHVNATNSRGLEMEFDITLPNVPCSKLKIDANDHQGQPQSLHLDQYHHVWKHRVRIEEDGRRTLVGSKSRLELGSTLLSEESLVDIANVSGKLVGEGGVLDDPNHDECGSCYGAGEEGECCNTCEDVRRVYRQRGWTLDTDAVNIVQCKEEQEKNEEGEGCNVRTFAY